MGQQAGGALRRAASGSDRPSSGAAGDHFDGVYRWVVCGKVVVIRVEGVADERATRDFEARLATYYKAEGPMKVIVLSDAASPVPKEGVTAGARDMIARIKPMISEIRMVVRRGSVLREAVASLFSAALTGVCAAHGIVYDRHVTLRAAVEAAAARDPFVDAPRLLARLRAAKVPVD